MAKKKTRAQKVKSAEKTAKNDIVYTYRSKITPIQQKGNISETLSTAPDLKKIFIATFIVITLNLVLYFLLQSQIIKLGFLGY